MSKSCVCEKHVYWLYTDQIEENKIGNDICWIKINTIDYLKRPPVFNIIDLRKVISYKPEKIHREGKSPYEVENYGPRMSRGPRRMSSYWL